MLNRHATFLRSNKREKTSGTATRSVAYPCACFEKPTNTWIHTQKELSSGGFPPSDQAGGIVVVSQRRGESKDSFNEPLIYSFFVIPAEAGIQ
jgi:hypothetical protein